MFWGGLRGALVMALALSLPLTFPDREVIINMTFGVVLFTLLVPGLTMEPLVRVLGMAPTKEKLSKYQEYKALIMADRAELQSVAKLKDETKISAAAHDAWKDQLQGQILDLSAKMESLQLTDSSLDELQDRQAKIYLLESRKDYLSKLVKEGVLTEESAHHLYVAVDSELDSIDGSAHTAIEKPQQTPTADTSYTG